MVFLQPKWFSAAHLSYSAPAPSLYPFTPSMPSPCAVPFTFSLFGQFCTPPIDHFDSLTHAPTTLDLHIQIFFALPVDDGMMEW